MLYEVEREAKNREPTRLRGFRRVAARAASQERSRPIFEKFHAWLEAELPKVLPKSPIGEAIQYALNHWAALKRPLEAGFLELDNGACERSVQTRRARTEKLVIRGKRQGRPNGRRSDEPVHDVQELEIDPEAYLRDVLDRISTHPARRIEELLPDRWQELRQAGDAELTNRT